MVREFPATASDAAGATRDMPEPSSSRLTLARVVSELQLLLATRGAARLADRVNVDNTADGERAA